MAQHKSSLEKTLQSAFKHKKAGTEVATAILAIEALVESGIDTAAAVENTDEKVTGRTRAACAHKAFGKRLADSISTLDAIIAEETIAVEAADVEIAGFGAPHKQNLRRVMIGAMARRDVGLMVADMVSKVEPVVDELITAYDVGGAKYIAGVNEVQEITVDAAADAGDFKLGFDGEETAAIAFDAVAADIKAALEDLDGIDLVDVVGDVATGFTVEFQGMLAERDVALLTIEDNTLEATAVPVDVQVAEQTPGVQGTAGTVAALELIKDALEG